MQPLKNRLYFRIKPFLPWRLRLLIKQSVAQRKRRMTGAIWPIYEPAGETPSGWPGWPEGKRFSVVLTHDVEGPAGLAKCRRLAQVERQMGFRSSFNFVPEGSYQLTEELRAELVRDGFEIGVHDRFHDGRLYSSQEGFRRHALEINRYAAKWGAVGYRSGFMLHNYDWHHLLDVLYDATSFDTDPFEPQPDGVGTIFPFWIQRPAAAPRGPGDPGREGYVQLPYSLPQDSTLFLLLQEATPEIWLRKLDWVAQRGGMALVGVHPDYIRFEDEAPGWFNFPVAHYRRLLDHIRSNYAGTYWQALPREVASFVHQHRQALVRQPRPASPAAGKKVWIDLENTPHAPFFAPIIRELERRGHRVVVTARDAYQACEMADLHGIPHQRIGRHYGRNLVLKVLGLGIRAVQLLAFARREKPNLTLSHGSRSQLAASSMLGIPSVMLDDYEHSHGPGLGRPRWMIVPEALAGISFDRNDSIAMRYYSGIKEDVYASGLVPDSGILTRLGLDSCGIIVTVRPPATEAHYHNPASETLFRRFMERALAQADVRIVLLPRNRRQESRIRSDNPEWFRGARVVVPDRVVDGLNLLWHSDLVVSGGGTMNREAAALGVPVYSIFRGRIGAIDRHLQSTGRLVLIESLRDVDEKILLRRRTRESAPASHPRRSLDEILAHLEEILAACP